MHAITITYQIFIMNTIHELLFGVLDIVTDGLFPNDSHKKLLSVLASSFTGL